VRQQTGPIGHSILAAIINATQVEEQEKGLACLSPISFWLGEKKKKKKKISADSKTAFDFR
jgi:hypothetical protein